MIHKILLSGIAVLLFPVFGNSQELSFEKIENLTFIEPVEISSTYIEDDKRLFIVEKAGKIYIIEDPEIEEPIKLATPFLDISSKVNAEFEGGLLGLAFHPNYSENGYFYVNYTFLDPNNFNQFSTRISRFTVDIENPNVSDPSSEIEVLTIAQPAKNHNGGDLAFGPDGYLYIPTGDGGGSNDQFKNGQNRISLLGKILRIDINTEPYSIPPDNPFAEDDFTLDEIWSLGWRNPWRIAFDPLNGDMWVADVGQDDLEEVNLEPAGEVGGLSYGWSCMEGTKEFNGSQCESMNHIDPVFEYNHDLGQKSITGGYVYRGTRHPDLVGKYIFTDFVDSKVFWLSEKSGEEIVTTRYDFTGSDLPFRITTFGESSDYELFFATLMDGKIWKVKTDVVINNSELTKNEPVKIFPNPANNQITIECTVGKLSDIKFFTLSGEQFTLEQVNINTYNTSGLMNGNYIIQYEIDGKTKSERFQVLK